MKWTDGIDSLHFVLLYKRLADTFCSALICAAILRQKVGSGDVFGSRHPEAIGIDAFPSL